MYSANGNGKVESEPTTRPYLDCEVNDAGNAQCLLVTGGNVFKHNDSFGWMVHNGRFWERENAQKRLDIAITNMLQLRVIDLVRAGRGEDAKKCIPNARIVGAVRSMFDELVPCRVDDFDADPNLLNCRNGVVDLRTGELTAHDTSQMFTYCVNADYRPDADTRAWEDWLLSVVDGGAEMVQYMQVLTGYSFTGLTREELFVYVFGPTRSGKGTFTETLLELAGRPLGIGAKMSTFTDKRSGGDQNFDLAVMRASRLVVASETEGNDWLNAAKVKNMTGGDWITCAYKHQDQFSYRPLYTIWLLSNHKVQTDVEDDAIWGRLRLLCFPNSHLGNEDKTLKERMKSPKNLEAVLKWVVDGAVRYYADGLVTPAVVTGAANSAREDIDFVQKWLDDNTVLHPGSREVYTVARDLYKDYLKWCEDMGVAAKKQRGFANALAAKGVEKSEPLRTPFNVQRVNYGITLNL